jgi:hypothetical protein
MAGITSTKKIKGQPHLLAYITPNEVEKLKALGGQETMTPEGIPAYPEWDVGQGVTKEHYDAGTTPRGSTFETFRGDKNVGVDNTLKQKFGTTKQQKEAKKALTKNQYYSTSPNQSFFEKMGTKKNNYNRNARQKFINYLIKEKQKNLQKGLMDDSIPGIDTMTMEELISFAPTVKDYVDKGFYKKDGAFAKGEKIPSYNINPDMPGLLSIVQDKFSGPVTQEKLMEYYNNINTLENLDPTDPNNSIKNLMETYQPNRYNLLYPTGGNDQPQVYLPQVLPTDDQDDSTEENEFEYRFGTGQKVGADVTKGFYNQGGRVPKNMGGIMNAVPRQGYFLGKIVKGVGKAIGSVADAAGKVLKSDFGKAALIGLGGYYLGGGQMFGLRPSAPGFSFGNLGKNLFLKSGKDAFTFKNLDPLKMAGLLTLGGAAMGPAKVDQMPGDGDRGGRLLDSQGNEVLPSGIRKEIDEAYESKDPERIKAIENYYAFLPPRDQYLPYPNYAVGGRVAAQEGGLMNLGGMEKDYRNEGGFVPIGKQEKADDVPARLSVNEFVFTADAVRNAGGGDIDKGAEVMENMMKNLENGGRVSEESQGNTGAQEMFSVSERIGEVI